MRVLHVHSGNMFGGVESALLTLVRESGCTPDMETTFALAFDGGSAASCARWAWRRT
jgi:hypothetical protein